MYGLTVSGPGLMPFVDPAFRVGSDPVELVVEASAGMARAKVASGPCSAGGVLGDVDNNSRVDFFDALLVDAVQPESLDDPAQQRRYIAGRCQR